MINFFAGRKILQPLFQLLYKLSVYGMNYNRSGLFSKTGEILVLKYAQKKLSATKNRVLFDVGGNRGDYSLAMAKVFHRNSDQIYCIEPSPEKFAVIEKNTAGKNISSFNIGFGDERSEQTLYGPGAFSGLSSVYKRRLDHAGITMNHEERVKLQTLDSFCLENEISRIDFLKLDIEGHEYKCLLGAKGMLENNRIKFLQFEFGGSNIDSRTYFQDFWYLLHDRFNIYRIVHDGLVHIKRYNESLEIFKNINFLAELKPTGSITA